MRPIRDSLALVCAWLVLLPPSPGRGQSVSLSKAPDLDKQRVCVISCIIGDSYDNIVRSVGCARHSCFCRDDLRPLASQYLSDCLPKWFSGCSSTEDYLAAASIYDRYCGFTAPATTPATTLASPTSSDDGTTSGAVTVSITVTSGPTVTVQTSSSSSTSFSSSSSSPGLGELLLVATIVSLLSLRR